MPKEVKIYFAISIPLFFITVAAEFGFMSYFKAFFLFFLLLPITFWAFFRGPRFFRKWGRIFVKWVDRRRPGLRDRLFRGFTKMFHHDPLFYDNSGELICRGSLYYDPRLAALVVLVALVGVGVELVVSHHQLAAGWALAALGPLVELLSDESEEGGAVDGKDGGAVSSGPTAPNKSEEGGAVDGKDGGAVSSGPTAPNKSEEGGYPTWVWVGLGIGAAFCIGGFFFLIWTGHIPTKPFTDLLGCTPTPNPEDIRSVAQEAAQQGSASAAETTSTITSQAVQQASQQINASAAETTSTITGQAVQQASQQINASLSGGGSALPRFGMYNLFEMTERFYARAGGVRTISVNSFFTPTEVMDILIDRTFIALRSGELVADVTIQRARELVEALGAGGGQALRDTVRHDLQLTGVIVETTHRLADSLPPSVWNNIQWAWDVLVHSEMASMVEFLKKQGVGAVQRDVFVRVFIEVLGCMGEAFKAAAVFLPADVARTKTVQFFFIYSQIGGLALRDEWQHLFVDIFKDA